MNRKKGLLIAVILVGLVVMVAGCELLQDYNVNVNDDKSGTITVTLKMNTSNYEAFSSTLIEPCPEPNSNTVLNWLGAQYFAGFSKQQLSNVSEGGDDYVRLRYTISPGNLNGVASISCYYDSGKTVFQDQRFITLCTEITNDPCMGGSITCDNVKVEYTLTMPRAITFTNGAQIGSNQAEWSFSADAPELITAQCNAPPTPTTATTTTATTTMPTSIPTTTACPDTDGDGWDDCFEATMGTNPNQQDTDNDGIIDSLDPNPLVASTTTATTTTTTITTTASATTTEERTPATPLIIVVMVIGVVAVLLRRKL